MISKDCFLNYSLGQLDKWFCSYKSRRCRRCNRIAIQHTAMCRDILVAKQWNNSEQENNVAFIMGVLFKGLSEFVQLAEITRDKKWHMNHYKTEKVWKLMWNCIDRFRFSATFLESNDFTFIQSKIKGLQKFFIDNFGYGVYSSPDILIKDEVCSICKNDSRACFHIPGTLYNGVMCCSIPQQVEIKSVSLVTVPRDPRCRIWPWNATGELTYSIMVMTLFRIDDWLIQA